VFDDVLLVTGIPRYTRLARCNCKPIFTQPLRGELIPLMIFDESSKYLIPSDYEDNSKFWSGNRTNETTDRIYW
jgi:hypothetical protein